jgi:uncharacterized protein (DUF2384 family)
VTAKQELQAIVNDFFKGDAEKINAWWSTPNPLLGHLKPSDMVAWNKGERLLKMVKQWRGEDGA